jgi:hypothetical protein
MISALLVVAAAAALGWPTLRELVKEFDVQKIDVPKVACGILLIAAILSYVNRPEPAPSPAPPEPAAFTLRGTFVGPDASPDAAVTAALFEELAAELEWDGMQAEPLLKTGVSFDELRLRARLLICRGVSLGDKHPRAREAIRGFLDRAAGTSGGPMSPEQRARWVAAFREIARAAADASR